MADNSDGSIVLKVSVDKSGLSKDLATLVKDIDKFYGSSSQKSKDNANNFNQFNQQVNILNQTLQQTFVQINNINNATEKTKNGAKKKADAIVTSFKRVGSALGIAFSISQIVRFSNEASKVASETEAYLMRLNTIYGEAGQTVYDYVNKNALALGMSKNSAYEAATSYGNLFATFTDGANNAKLTNEMLKATAVIASQTGRTYDEVFEKIRSGLYGNTRAIDDLGISVRKSSIINSESFQQISGGVLKYNDLTDAQLQQIRALEILRQSHALYGDEVINSTALARSQFAAAFADFKASWGAVINTILIPVLNVLTTILNYATKVLNALSGISGKKKQSFSGSGISNVGVSSGGTTGSGSGTGGSKKGSSGKSKEEKDLENQIKSIQKKNKEIQKQKKLQQKVNKEQDKQLASFDTLEILQSQKNDETLEALDNEIDKNNEIIDQLQEKLELLREAKQEQVSSSGGTGGGVSGVAGGGSLLDTGDIGDDGAAPINEKLVAFTAITGMALAGLGIILICTGHWLVGVPMVAAGWIGIEASIQMAKELDDAKRNQLAAFAAVAGLAAVGIGILLLLTKKYLIGIGLIVTGAIYLGAAYGLSSDAVKEKIKEEAERLYPLLKEIASVAFIVGCILLFTPHILLGLTLIISGIATLVTATNLTSEDFKSAITKICQEFAPILKQAGIVMCVIGMLLLFSNMILKGLAMIGVGIVAFFAATAIEEGVLEHKSLEEALRAAAEAAAPMIKKLGVVIFIVGVVLMFSKQFLLGFGFMLLGATAYMTATSIKEGKFDHTSLIDGFKDIAGKATKAMLVLGAICFVIGLVMCLLPGGALFGYGLKLMAMGGGAVFTANAIDKEVLDGTAFRNSIGEELDKIYTTVSEKVKKIKDKIDEIGEKIGEKITGKNKYGFPTDLEFKPAPKKDGRRRTRSTEIDVPALARGAVLPANRAFLAVVGDQKRGTNIEAPAELIKQMAIQAIQETQGSLQGQQTVREEHYYLDQTELMSVLYKLVKGGERIQGNSLINQGGSLI